jgi:peptide/nickel transport system substrate-binding protein
VIQLYDFLARLDHNAQVQLSLAEEITPNANGTLWTIRLHPGVTFHNGKDLTADDVIYTFKRIGNPKNPLIGRSFLGPIDLQGMKKLDSLTLQVPFQSPYSTFVKAIGGFYNNMSIVPTDYDPKHPVGSGPFKYQSFTPGQQSTFVRNPDYWKQGLPYVDTLVITDMTDETTQINALLAHQVDAVSLLSSQSIDAVQSGGGKVVISPAGGITPFTMRVDVPPFNDVRVRQAMRLLVDRAQMMDVVFNGHGTLGNDIFSIWDPQYDRSIPQRQQDIGQAKSLLKAANREGLQVVLVTSDIAQGTIGAAQVFAQQATKAGVDVHLRQLPVTQFFGSNYLQWPFAQDYWYYGPYLPQVGQETLPKAQFNETHFDNPTYNRLYSEAISTTDSSRQTELAHEMQRIDYNEGGLIVPYFSPVVDAHSTSLHGVVPSKTGFPLSDWEFSTFWLE